MLSVMTFSRTEKNATLRIASYLVSFMMSVVLKSIMLSVIIPNVVMLTVGVPFP
jgi:heme/copper-type cytochrome/quinol oxidase subunit 4